MTAQPPHRIRRKATTAEREKYQQLRETPDEEKPAIPQEARRRQAAREAATGNLQHACRLLKAERERQGLSLADLQERTGMQRSALRRLESDPDSNPTLTTLPRYAGALGKKLLIALADDDAA